MKRLALMWTTTVLLTSCIPAAAQVGANNGLLNPNLASEEELSAVDGLDGDAVKALLDGRPFLRAADLHAVISAHVADDAYDTIYGALWVPIDLNDTTSEEIGLIPGVGRRMTHEFEEYRPYTALAQFHREIGKGIISQSYIASHRRLAFGAARTMRNGRMNAARTCSIDRFGIATSSSSWAFDG